MKLLGLEFALTIKRSEARRVPNLDQLIPLVPRAISSFFFKLSTERSSEFQELELLSTLPGSYIETAVSIVDYQAFVVYVAFQNSTDNETTLLSLAFILSPSDHEWSCMKTNFSSNPFFILKTNENHPVLRRFNRQVLTLSEEIIDDEIDRMLVSERLMVAAERALAFPHFLDPTYCFF